MEAIDLRVLDQRPIDLDVHDARPVVWGTSEYIPMVVSDLPEYEGPYTATPAWDAQTLATAHRAMSEDLTVLEIQKLEAPNDAGGLTLTI